MPGFPKEYLKKDQDDSYETRANSFRFGFEEKDTEVPQADSSSHLNKPDIQSRHKPFPLDKYLEKGKFNDYGSSTGEGYSQQSDHFEYGDRDNYDQDFLSKSNINELTFRSKNNYREQAYSTESNGIAPLAKYFLIISIVFFVVALGFSGLVNVESLTQSTEKCQEVIQEKQAIGLDTQDLTCDSPELLPGVPNYIAGISNYRSVQRDLKNQENNLLLQIQIIEFQSNDIIDKLTSLEVDHSDIEKPIGVINLKQNLDNYQTYKETLENRLVSNYYKISNLIATFRKTIDLNQSNINLAEYENFYKNIQELSLDDQIFSYSEIYQRYLDLRQVIVAKISVDFDNQGLRKFENQSFFELLKALPKKEATGIVSNEELVITGNAVIDDYIIDKATERGYLKQSVLSQDEVERLTEDGLVAEVSESWLAMQKQAKNENIELGLTSTYRSVEDQKKIFMDRLESAFNQKFDQVFSIENLLAVDYGSLIIQILEFTAPPGYSRHHSGYTIDLFGSTPIFANSPGYTWISANNYANAKKFGFVPSYPEGVKNQGPEPEPWEYIWVGTDILLKN